MKNFIMFSLLLCLCSGCAVKTSTKMSSAYVMPPINDSLKDKSCKQALSNANANPISNYTNIGISHDNIYYAKYKSAETGYIYECNYTAQDSFYIYGEGWENIKPTGKLSEAAQKGCIVLTYDDPVYNTSMTDVICE